MHTRSRFVIWSAFFLSAQAAVGLPVKWTFPLKGYHEGLPFADARTGVLVWGEGDTVKLTIGRADLWDHRGGGSMPAYTNVAELVRRGDAAGLKALLRKNDVPGEPRFPQMIPFARIVLKLDGWTLKSGELDPLTGLARLVCTDAAGRETAVPIAMSMKGHRFAMKFPESARPQVSIRPSWDARTWLANRLAGLGFKPPAKWSEGDSAGFSWTLPVDAPVALGYTLRSGELVVEADRTDGRIVPTAGFAETEAESRAFWRAFWSKTATVSVPDETIQYLYEFGMYKFASMTDPDGVPAGLQGPWLDDNHFIPWNGDYHFNINIQECYAPAYRSGRLENLMPLFRMIRSWWPRLNENARRFCGVEDGFALPHAVDDRGTAIGSFWSGTIDHGSTAWVADMMFKYAKYGRDLEFLRTDAYPFMKGAMKVYRALMEEKDGRLRLPLMPSPEMGYVEPRSFVGVNTSFQLAAAHRLARNLIEAAGMLGESPDPMWLDVESRLPQYSLVGGHVAIWEGRDLYESHRHHSHLAGFFPFDTIDVDKDRDVVNATYHKWVRCGIGNWSGWAFPWGAVLHVHVGDADAAVWLLKTWDKFFCNEGHGSRHDCYRPGVTNMRRGPNAMAFGVIDDRTKTEEIMQMDGQCAATAAVLELMVHEVNGKNEFFRGCPREWREVSFRNILLSDGTRVSGRRVDGKVEVFPGDAP